MEFKLKPFYTAVFLYLIANFIFLILGLMNNNFINMEFLVFHIETNVLIYAFILQIFSLLFIIGLYKIFSEKNIDNHNIFGNFAGVGLTIWQFLFLIFALIWGLGVVDAVNRVSPFLVRLSNFISADILYFLIAPSLRSNKLYVLNTVLYLISSIIRGWLGGIVISFFIYLCRVEYLKVSLKSFILFISVFFIILMLSPFLIDLKFLIRSGESIVFDTSNYGVKFEAATDYLLGRFQHLGHTALLINNADHYRQLYDFNKILPYWLEGIPQYYIYKLLGNSELFSYSQVMAIYDFGANPNQPWNANTGISGWIVLLQEKSILFFIYWGGLIALFFKFLVKYANQQTFNVVSVLMIIFFYHGWLGSFFNLIILSFLVIFFKKLRFR